MNQPMGQSQSPPPNYAQPTPGSGQKTDQFQPLPEAFGYIEENVLAEWSRVKELVFTGTVVPTASTK